MIGSPEQPEGRYEIYRGVHGNGKVESIWFPGSISGAELMEAISKEFPNVALEKINIMTTEDGMLSISIEE